MKIIAEIGSNVKNLKDCFYCVDKAAEAGADIVKFQYFTDHDMYGFNLGNQLIIHDSWLPQIKERCDKNKIEFTCTFFDPISLRRNSGLVSLVKIASSDMLFEELLSEAKFLKKTVLLSTGGHTEDQVKLAVKMLDKRRLVLMYCESVYPAKRMDLDKLEILKQFHKKVGVSDHSIDVYHTPILARDRGVLYYEKHANFLDYTDTPDAPHSLNFKEFKDMVSKVNSKKDLHLLSCDEIDMVSMYNRRCVATKLIKVGEKLVYGDNFGYYRSMKPEMNGYLFPADVNNKVAKKEIVQGQTITERQA